MTFTISIGALVVLCISLLLFVGVTILCHWQGMFDGGGGYAGGLDSLFTVIAYAVLWAIPSLATWAIYATWFRGGAQ